MNNYEAIYCVMLGTEQFRIISPIFRDNLYVGHFENWPAHEAPFSFFSDKKDEFSLTKEAKFVDSILK
jgi:hypothetical protein